MARHRQWLDPYLPSPVSSPTTPRPHLTLTYATSLDAALTGIPGQQTWISGPESTSMTHYLRSAHDAILVGVGTALAANPSLNCRLEGVRPDAHPRPVIIDPCGRWVPDKTQKVLQAARAGQGKGPWIVTARQPDEGHRALLGELGGEYIVCPTEESSYIAWSVILEMLARRGVRSVMVEGGAHVINTLLAPAHKHLVDSVVVTVAPCWLGTGSVIASPSRESVTASNTLAQLENVSWNQLGRDVVLCGKVSRS